MLPPLPRCSGGAYSSLLLAHPYQPSPEGLPGRPAHRHFRGLLSVHSRCEPAHSRGHQFVTRYPKASDISSPPCLLRLLPAGAVAGWGSHPLENAALSRRTPEAAIRDNCGERPRLGGFRLNSGAVPFGLQSMLRLAQIGPTIRGELAIGRISSRRKLH